MVGQGKERLHHGGDSTSKYYFTTLQTPNQLSISLFLLLSPLNIRCWMLDVGRSMFDVYLFQ